ncbi:hypothetical protein EO98_15335 [Methanosarcina sp. 2.H.T.1A.6]|uniref:DUF262 domain-containing protein n=1 Tax=unclassified Methanosarcina TaxID=2644672 RepID=UPI0006221B43|nr:MULTISPECIES: DUF262 domain-containing protein [unclassified Methanosarcina]KKG15193.1 hypothetical protein EO94_06690 [Methanosarcina sp. 2.H.T.1A.3]KKG22565.1 hypothetical protein EO97_04605 [Methanosarcina sp. 2.H.T.1A.15]KKG22878.1 hypothetical protein EO98_15335 [Methanosarcina sp. 2.H.T.1A.6]KKG24392.1 hypothetical protein EO96_14530 [Methanosarcina sp. 2.H.T.1A.8]
MDNSYTINEIIKMIGRNEVYLPAIQRKFVWKPEQIENIFDSIMKGYPIGMFLFWIVQGNDKDEYTFYKFMQDYHERDKVYNDIAPKPELKEKIIGVLDGQQRLNSMYIALQGTYAYKKPYAQWKNDAAFSKRMFYLNLFKPSSLSEGEDQNYQFKFLDDSEAKRINKDNFWFLIRDVLTWGNDPDIDYHYDNLFETTIVSEEIEDLLKEKRREIKYTLRTLHKKLVEDKSILYYKVEDKSLDDISDIFVRVNSGGTILSKTDLLFSTIVANWEKGRDEIEKFLLKINKKGDGFRFNNDFVMRSCLVLTDCPVLFKVKSFKKENIDKIKAEWDNIKASIDKSIDVLIKFGFNEENLTSQNAVIPIAYHYMKKGNDSPDSLEGQRRYILHALLRKAYGGQGDQVLSSFREVMREKKDENYVLKSNKFSFDLLLQTNLPGNKSLKIMEDDIEDILEYKKGPYTFMVLSLLYPSLKFDQIKFHQDHIHPVSMFINSKFEKFGIPAEKWSEWQDKKDMLPNLQLMKGEENESKNKIPFKQWLEDTCSPLEISKFKAENYIPETVSLEFENFDEFFEERKAILKNEIKKFLM